MSRPILFLDIDGVLNDHSKLPGSVYCGIDRGPVKELNRIIAETNAWVVLTSSWRYQILGGAMTKSGFEYMLASHGIVLNKNWELITDCLPLDCDVHKGSNRGEQIASWLTKHTRLGLDCNFAVLDDVPEGMSMAPVEHKLVKTDGEVGLTYADACNVIRLLKGEPKYEPRQVMPRVGGKSFRCDCGGNVFTEYAPLRYDCNSCRALYAGEKESAKP